MIQRCRYLVAKQPPPRAARYRLTSGSINSEVRRSCAHSLGLDKENQVFPRPTPSSMPEQSHRLIACAIELMIIAYHHIWPITADRTTRGQTLLVKPNSLPNITCRPTSKPNITTCPSCPWDALLAPVLVRNPGNTLIVKVAKRPALAHKFANYH